MTRTNVWTSFGGIARGSVSGSLILILLFRSDKGRMSWSMRKWMKAMMETMRVLTVEI
jgi:hypothetical protein